MATPSTSYPQPYPTTIKQLPVEYDQLINNFLDNIEFDACQAKSLCFVTDSLGYITTNAKSQMGILAESIVNIIETFSSNAANFAVWDTENSLLGIYRPYYIDLNIIGMLKIVGDIDFSVLVSIINPVSQISDSDYRNCWNQIIEICGNCKRGF